MRSFLNACGMAGPLQLTVKGPGEDETCTRLLHQPFALIGRDPRSDLYLEDPHVSRRHAYLQVVEGWAFWTDLESRTGTLSGGQVCRHGWLDAGRPIRIGPHEIQCLPDVGQAGVNDRASGPPQATPLTARSHSREALPEVTLEFLNGPSRSACWPMNRVMSLIGSAGGCKFRLADPSVSPFHGSLIRTPLGLWIVDLFGANEIEVNGVASRYSLLNDGDVLVVGRYRIQIRSRFPERLADRGPGDSGRAMVHIPRPVGGDPLPAPVSDLPAAGVFQPLQTLARVASVDWPPLVPAFPASLEKHELTESVLVPLVNQFGLMQQQMFDQFQQAMSMMVQMFGTLHRDQMDVIREELDQLRELTKEFNALKQELAAHTQSHAAAAPATARAETLPASSAAARLNTSASAKPAAEARAGRPGAAHAPSDARPGPRTSRPNAEAPPNAPAPSAASPQPSPESDRDVIVWLHQRIATLQEERETRWQKILKLLPGVSG